MTGENTNDHEDDVGPKSLLLGVVAAAATGRADPSPRDRPWPRGLRWTRFVGVGLFPYGLILNLATLGITAGLIAGTYSLLQTETAERHLDVADGTLFLATFATTAPLALLDRYPLGAWRVNVVAMALFDTRDWLTVPYVPAGSVAAIVLVYAVALRCRRGITLGAGLLTVAGAWAKDVETAPGASVLVLLALLVGYTVRLRHTSRRELAEQKKRHQDAEAVLMERQRIARELHDVVAHHMSMIAIQAEAAPYKVDEVPDEIRRDLSEIRSTALDALTEMRRILGVLRAADGSQTAPQPDLGRLEELLSGARGAGLKIAARLEGMLDGLPPGIGLTSYRIVQEALSNAMRHAPGSRVDVAITRENGILRLNVVNGPPGDGHRPAPSPPGGGHGLVGMRERAAILDGELTAEPTPEGGFAVIATLPVPERA